MWNFLDHLRTLSEDERRSFAGVSAFIITAIILLPVLFFRGIHLPKANADKKPIPIEIKNSEELTDAFTAHVNEIKEMYGMMTTAMTEDPLSESSQTSTTTATTTQVFDIGKNTASALTGTGTPIQ